MSLDRIDFISEYCDRWCARCAFTERCSSFAVEAAMAMCDGDVAAALELAVGAPTNPGSERGANVGRRMEELLEHFAPTDADLKQLDDERRARDARVRSNPLSESSIDYTIAVYRWLKEHPEVDAHGDPAVRAHAEVIAWDGHLIAAKLRRALSGRDEFLHGNPMDDHPVQNDWNGSAKVALISLQRSAAGWRALQAALADPAAAALLELAEQLSVELVRVFPDATTFVRPGFDGPERPFPWQLAKDDDRREGEEEA